MNTMSRRFQPFRKHQPRDEQSWLPVIAVVLLGAFDLGLIGYLVHGIWIFAR